RTSYTRHPHPRRAPRLRGRTLRSHSRQARRQDARWRAAKPRAHPVSDRRATMSAQVAPRADEYWVHHPLLRTFVCEAKAIIAAAASPLSALAALRAPFARLLADREWLPEVFRQACETGRMGGGIGQWLLYRSADHSLTLFSLVVPPGSATPVHDHLAWGLVGLYEGGQEESIYRVDHAAGQGSGRLEV